MEDILRTGKCRAIGVSNYGVHHLEELHANSTVRPAVNQVWGGFLLGVLLHCMPLWCLHSSVLARPTSFFLRPATHCDHLPVLVTLRGESNVTIRPTYAYIFQAP